MNIVRSFQRVRTSKGKKISDIKGIIGLDSFSKKVTNVSYSKNNNT